MSNNKKKIIIFSALAFLISFFAYQQFKKIPYLKQILIKELITQTQSFVPIKILLKDISFGLFPFQAELIGVQLEPHLKTHFPEPILVDKIIIKFNLLSLLTQRPELNEVEIIRPHFFIDLSKTQSSSNKDEFQIEQLSYIMKKLNGLKVKIVGADWVANLKNSTQIGSKNSNLSAQILTKKIILNLSNPQLWMQHNKNHYSDIQFQIDGELTPEKVTLQNLVKHKGSQLETHLELWPLSDIFKSPRIDIKSALYLQSADWLTQLLGLKQLSGEVQVDTELSLLKNQVLSQKIDFKSFQLAVNQFQIGNIQSQFHLNESGLRGHKISILNKEISADIHDWSIGWEAPFNFKSIQAQTKLKIYKIDLRPFLESIKVHKVPVDLTLSGQFDCSINIKPTFETSCFGGAQGQGLHVSSTSDMKNSIVKLNPFTARGNVLIDQKHVEYKADLNLDSATGQSSGSINFETGFDILFNGNQIDLDQINTIAGLKFNGLINVNGQTQGGSKSATFKLTGNSDNFRFSELNLGKISTTLSYSKGLLSVSDISASKGQSQYSGYILVDLLNNSLDYHIKSDLIYGEDLYSVFSDFLPNQFLSQGKGKFNLHVTGPYDWKSWSHELDFQLDKALLLNEYFDQIKIKSSMNNPILNIKEGVFNKGEHSLKLYGQGDLAGDGIIRLSGQSIPLEYFDNIALLGANLLGNVDFQTEVKALLAEPEWFHKMTLSQLSLSEYPLLDAKMQISSNKLGTTSSINYGIDTFVFSGFLPPMINSNEEAKIYIKSSKFQPKPFFTLIGATGIIDEYDSLIDGEFEYQFNRTRPYQGNGHIILSNAYVKRLNSELKISNTSKITIKDGFVSPFYIQFKGQPKQTLILIGDGQLGQSFSLSVEPSFDVQLLHPFFPFFEDFRGQVKGRVTFYGLPNTPTVFGKLKFENGYIHLKNFIQGFNSVSGEARFDNQDIMIDQFSAVIGDGIAQGKGSIKIAGYRNIQLDIPITISPLIFEPLDGIRAKSQGQLHFIGNWFPYVLLGNLSVTEGLISKEFEQSDSVFIRRSSLLPKVFLKDASQPLLLSINAKTVSPISIKNSMIDGKVTGDLNISGPAQFPIIQGNSEIVKGSKVLFRENEFRVDQGFVKFLGATELDPEIFLVADARIDKYDVNMNIQGKSSNPVLRLSSQPTLSEQDIISLLALGQLSNDIEKQIQAPSSQTQAEAQISAALLETIPLFKKAQKAVGVTVQISSAFDSNSNTEFKKVSITKKLNKKTKVVATSGDQGYREFKFEYSLSDHLSAIGRYKQQDNLNSGLSLDNQGRNDSILGLDLEYRKEFK